MAQSLSYQLVFAASALLMGVVMALVYDLLKALRLLLHCGFFTALFDGLFCLSLLWGLFLLSMTAGDGRLRIYPVLCCSLGFGMYYFMFGSRVSLFFRVLFTKLARPLLFLWRKFVLFSKKVFQIFSGWYRMRGNSGSVCSNISEAPENGEREYTHEAKKNQPVHKNCHSRTDGIRRHKSGISQAPDHPGAGKA